MSYAFVLLDAVVAKRPRISSRAMLLDVDFSQADDTVQRIKIVVPRWNRDLDDVTRRSRVLIGGSLCAGARPHIVAGSSTILWLSPDEDRDRTAPRVHFVEAHWRLLGTGKRVRIRGHIRGRAGVAGRVRRLADETQANEFLPDK